MFYETKQYSLEFKEECDAPPVVMNLWDHNEGFGQKYLGRAIITLEEMSKVYCIDRTLKEDETKEIPKPKWHDIRLGNNPCDPVVGQVLCSFIICEND
jgi:hypothetical protein